MEFWAKAVVIAAEKHYFSAAFIIWDSVDFVPFALSCHKPGC